VIIDSFIMLGLAARSTQPDAVREISEVESLWDQANHRSQDRK